MAGRIFINYRRGDDPGFTTALFQLLKAHFPPERLFFDVGGSIQPGDDFHEVIDAQVAGCVVMLAVIGPRWVEQLRARAGDANDFVVLELTSALQQGKRVLPVRVGGARPLSADGLPTVLQRLARIQAEELRPEHFEADGLRLVGWLQARMPSRAPSPSGTTWTAEPGAMEFVKVPAGPFWMGATTEPGGRNFDPEAGEDEAPVRLVNITQDYWMGKHPVTNEQYRTFVDTTGHRPAGSFGQSGFDHPQQPVTGVDWHDATAFCAWMTNQLERGWVVALPTEAMWERAARGSDGRRYPWGDADPDPTRAVFDEAALATVGGRPAGAGPFGTHDQAGQVWEWCRDGYAPYTAAAGRVDHRVNTVANAHASRRVVRGGSWSLDTWGLRAAYRSGGHPDNRSGFRGFRVCVYRKSGGRS